LLCTSAASAEFAADKTWTIPNEPATDAPVTHVEVWPANDSPRVRGIQVGFWNRAGSVEGLQLGYGCTQMAHRVDGVQLGLLWNYTHVFSGLQLGLAASNLEHGRGVQLGAFTYAAKDISGVQVGLLNFAGTTDFAVGLFNWSSNGRTELQTDVGSGSTFGARVRNGSRWYQYNYGYAYAWSSARHAVAAGPGFHLSLGRTALDLDALAQYFPKTEQQGEHRSGRLVAELALSAAVRVWSSLHVVAGAGLRGAKGRVDELALGEPIATRASYHLAVVGFGGLRIELTASATEAPQQDRK
jgi:hypothetical protein